jgi:hypothetical protein
MAALTATRMFARGWLTEHVACSVTRATQTMQIGFICMADD